MPASKEVALKDLSHVLKFFEDGLTRAWVRFQGECDIPLLTFDAVTRANAYHCYAKNVIREEIGSYQRARKGKYQGMFYISVQSLDGRSYYLLKIRKLDTRLRPCRSSLETEQSRKFRNQEQLSIPSLNAPTTNLHLGYVLNSIESDIAEIHIACPNGEDVLWNIPLTKTAQPLVLPISQDRPEIAKSARRVKKKQNP